MEGRADLSTLSGQKPNPRLCWAFHICKPGAEGSRKRQQVGLEARIRGLGKVGKNGQGQDRGRAKKMKKEQ